MENCNINSGLVQKVLFLLKVNYDFWGVFFSHPKGSRQLFMFLIKTWILNPFFILTVTFMIVELYLNVFQVTIHHFWCSTVTQWTIWSSIWRQTFPPVFPTITKDLWPFGLDPRNFSWQIFIVFLSAWYASLPCLDRFSSDLYLFRF